MADNISPEWLAGQVAAYKLVFPKLQLYAAAMERVLKAACAVAIPERIVQVRAKSVSSFAEKCVRKHDKYQSNPVEKMTDLCGARVIVQTIAQVDAVKLFIENNFKVIERDDKSSSLGDDKFGYRDMHYLVTLKPDRAGRIGFSEAEIASIGESIAEVQVRSVAQHAWADTLHDRTYKTPLKLSPEAKRTAALLAAVMEDGDRSFDRLTGEIDGMVANYSAHADRQTVETEIKTQRLIFDNETDEHERVKMAVRLARLLVPCGKFQEAVTLLSTLPVSKIDAALRSEWLLELGHALCRVHRQQTTSKEFRDGQDHLREVVAYCSEQDLVVVPNLRKRRSLLARAYSRLADSWAQVKNAEAQARDNYRLALETEPTNPYHLANQLGFEIYCARQSAMVESMGPVIRQGVATCRQHALAGTELPYALFTAGRLSLLLGEVPAALGWYALGLRHIFDGRSCVPDDVLQDELEWIERIHFGAKAPQEQRWVRRLVELAQGFKSAADNLKNEGRVLVVAGGAATMPPELLGKIRPMLTNALAQFQGKVISGGTKSGIPGCLGDIAAQLQQRKQFQLIGYIPSRLAADAPRDERYDKIIVDAEDNFSPSQILKMWEDLLGQGVSPKQVTVLGFGGGPITAVEYRIAFAFGATVAAVSETGGVSDEILADPIWAKSPGIIALPFDAASIQALATYPTLLPSAGALEKMAQGFHRKYLAGQIKSLPEKLRPWENLPITYQTANLEQAKYAVEILRVAGFDVRPVTGGADAIKDFSDPKFAAEVERMAELEHGRWNVERLRDGWRPGSKRDDKEKVHNCLVTWENLPREIRKYDCDAVGAFPQILTMAGLEIFKK